jgi:hypothetical protein
MGDINEAVVREYFESLGFLVSQPRKYSVPARPKTFEEELDLLVHNPLVKESRPPENFVCTTEDVRALSCAVVAVRGWHTERFSVSRIEQTPEIVRFAEPEPIKLAAGLLGTEAFVKLLCLPGLPASGEQRKKTIDLLRHKGIDGVLTFRTMLLALIRQTDTTKNYEKSDVLQIIRLLKNYDFIRDAQLDLFPSRRRPHKPRPPAAAPPATGTT